MPQVRARLREFARREREPAMLTIKIVLACMLSFALAEALDTSDAPVLAPLTALLVVQVTMQETVTMGMERIVSVVAGVVLAVLIAGVVGLTWWSLGLVVGLGVVAGRLLRLGPHLPEVAISAMLVLAVGGARSAAWGRIVETLVGAVVGVLVNLLLAPPVFVQPAGDAIAELAERLARFCRDLADAVERDWSRGTAQAFLNTARELGAAVARADRQLCRAEESAKLNPRGRLARDAEPRLRTTLGALERVQVGLRNVARTLLDRTFFVPEEEQDRPYSPAARAALADVLRTVAVALDNVVEVTAQRSTSPDTVERIVAHLEALEDARHRLANALLVDPHTDPAAWAQNGALLDAVDRLRVELTTALHPPETPWPPPLLADPRRVVSRALRRRRRPSAAP
jgi:uncharacterized membrane protein YccC